MSDFEIQGKKLLNKATETLKDSINKIKLIPYKRIFTKSGYNYIIPNKRKTITMQGVVGVNVEYELSDNIGYFKGVKAEINTQEKIVGDFFIEYKDLIIFVNGFDGFTESAGQYRYVGVALRSDRIHLINDSLANADYGYSCLDIIVDIPDYVILPKFETLAKESFKEGVILAEIQEQKTLNLFNLGLDSISQSLVDSVRFVLVNMNRAEATKFLKAILDYSLKSQNFGIVSNPEIKEISDYDNVSNLRSVLYEIVVKISYNIEIKEKVVEKGIKNVLFYISPIK